MMQKKKSSEKKTQIGMQKFLPKKNGTKKKAKFRRSL